MSSVLLEYEEKSYSVEAIQKAAYRLINLITVDINSSGDVILCTISKNIATDDESFRESIEEFKKEVLDQQLRQKLKTETESVRNLILSLVFSQTKLQNNE